MVDEVELSQAKPINVVNSARRIALFGAAGLLACGVGALAGYWWLHSGVIQGEEAKLLSASFEDLDGNTRSMSEWQGKTLVVNFWATWCGPCREEVPEFVQAQADFAAKNLQFVGIAIDRRASVQKFVRELGVNYPILIGDPAWLEMIKTMGNPQGVLPFSLVINPGGDVRLRRVGRLNYREIADIFA